MPLQSSGQITLDEIHVEAGGTTDTQATVNDTDIRGLISASSASEMEFADFYGADGGGGGGGGGISEGLSSSLDSVTGQNASWSTRNVDISAYAGEDVKLVFIYTNGSSGTSYQGDLQLDDIRLDGTTYSFEASTESWQTSTTDVPASSYSGASFVSLATGTTSYRWNRDAFGTPSGSTGLSTADAGTYYVYAETSGSGTLGDNYVLRSPTVTLGSSPTLQYAEARSGGNIGTLNVYLDVQGSGGGGGGGNSDFGSYSYSSTNQTQTGDTLEQTAITSVGNGNTCRIFVRFRLSGTTLYLECSEKIGINATMRNANSAGVSTGSFTQLTSAFTTMGTLTVPSTVDVKINWTSTSSGSTGSASVTPSSFYSTTYGLQDNIYRTLTNGQSAGFYIQAATFFNGNRRIFGSLTLGVNATGYNENASIATHDFDVESIETGGGGGQFCLHESVKIDSEYGPIFVNDIEKIVRVWSWNFDRNEKELVDVLEVIKVSHDNLWSIDGLLLTEDHVIYTENNEAVCVSPVKAFSNYEIKARQIATGDVLHTLDGSIRKVNSISRYEGTHTTYTLKTINRNFYADGVLVDGEI